MEGYDLAQVTALMDWSWMRLLLLLGVTASVSLSVQLFTDHDSFTYVCHFPFRGPP